MNTASASGADAGMSVNSKDYWEFRFSRDWVRNEGPAQSRFFTRLAVEHMPEWLLRAIRAEGLTVCDWGCAQGDGTDLLRQLLRPSRTVGIDFATTAVRRARKAYPACEFRSDNVLAGEVVERFDILFSSNTLEHFHEPFDVLTSISALASRFLVLLLPFREYDRIDEHFATFDFSNVRLAFPGWNLVHADAFDARTEQPCYWAGEQILLVYATNEETVRLGLSLAQVTMATSAETEPVVERPATKAAPTLDQHTPLSPEVDAVSFVQSKPEPQLNRTWQALKSRGEEFLAAARQAKASVRRTRKKWKNRLLGRPDPAPKPSAPLKLTDQDRYVMERTAQSHYLAHYIAHGCDPARQDFFNRELLCRIEREDKVVLYPLSYPRELTQRPDHVIRHLAEHGYTCIMMAVDDKPPFVDEAGFRVFVTNLFPDTVKHFAGKRPIVYITYPFFSYLVEHIPRCVAMYDVLDDLSVFSLHCEQMRADHEALLARSDVALFSSNVLREANAATPTRKGFLVTNGVWLQDFRRNDVACHEPGFKKPAGKYVIGYHGAISELLDWVLLENILHDERIHLVLIGPVTRFAEDSESATDGDVQQRVLAHERVTHLPPVPYRSLVRYLAHFDAGIVPFVVNAKTNPVSPLKLFEYMAVGLPAFATPTRTLSEYSDVIHVADAAELPQKIARVIDGHEAARSQYQELLQRVDWGSQLAPVREELDQLIMGSSGSKASPRRVDIINVNFFDWDGLTLYKGGAERYVYDLACLFRDRGWEVRILQNANRPFERAFKGVPVVGVVTGSGSDFRGMSRKFREVCADADLVVASPLDLACELRDLSVIGINHGIYWDHKYKSLSNLNHGEYKNLFDALKLVKRCVCVDTNFINWVRTYDYALGHKLEYVPNYFDGSVFHSSPKDFTGELRILYPRRLYEARGVFIALKAFAYLLEKYRGIQLQLVGQANDDDGRVVSEFISRYPGRITWEERDMEQMHEVYANSHVVLIPTMYAEGTSLSCLEAMATNNAVIATNIGGLANLVVDGYNGYLIEPKVEALVEALESLLNDRQLIGEMAARGVQMAAVFERAKWISRWQEAISRFHG